MCSFACASLSGSNLIIPNSRFYGVREKMEQFTRRQNLMFLDCCFLQLEGLGSVELNSEINSFLLLTKLITLF